MAVQFNRWCIRSNTTLNGAINNTVTSLIVTDASIFPLLPYFYILIDNELFYVTAVSGSTFTVIRGQDGSSAASHLNLAPVYGILTGGNLDKRLSSIIQRGLVSEVNSSFLSEVSAPGRIFIPTNSPILTYDNGIDLLTKYERWHDIIPWNDNFNWINQGTSSYNQFADLPYFIFINSGSTGDNIRANWVNNIAHTGGTIVRLFPTPNLSSDYIEFGLLVFDDTSGKFITLGVKALNDTGPPVRVGLTIQIDKYTNTTTKSANYFSLPVVPESVKYLKIIDPSSGNLSFQVGPDPMNMAEIFSVSRTDWTSGLNRIGIFGNPRAAGSSLKVYNYYSNVT